MADAYVRNAFPVGYGAAMSLFVEMLISAGWVYKASGDGLAGYSSTGKIFTGTGSGALGWNNAKAWARVQSPSGKEWLFQHDAAANTRFRYSPAAQFTGGSPSATVTPSATDAVTVRGGGTDAVPTYGAWLSSLVTSGTVVFQGHASDDNGYGFWFAGQASPSGAKSACLIYDPVAGAAEDPDPYVIHCATANACAQTTSNLAREYVLNSNDARSNLAPGGSTEGCFGFMDLAMSAFVYLEPAGYVCEGNTTFSSGVVYVVGGARGVANPFNGKHESLPLMYMRPTYSTSTAHAGCGFKGWGKIARWTTQSRASFSDTLDNKAWIAYGAFWLAWDGTTTPTP